MYYFQKKIIQVEKAVQCGFELVICGPQARYLTHLADDKVIFNQVDWFKQFNKTIKPHLVALYLKMHILI